MMYDLCLASNWEYDDGFIRILGSACDVRGFHLLTVTPANLAEVLPPLARQESGFRVFLDRASEADPAFLPLVEIATATGARRLNSRELADRAYDKAAMQRAFQEAGIRTPKTVILPAFCDQPDLPEIDLFPLGGLFAVKPALGGGGEGVAVEVTRLEQVRSEREKFPEQQYLLQEHIFPKIVGGFPAWFRVLYCLGKIYPSFWDTTTHVYTAICPYDEFTLGLQDLRKVMNCIAEVCKLDLFSSELVLTEDDRLLAVDYVNDPIDLRLKSEALDGAPDEIVRSVVADLMASLKK